MRTFTGEVHRLRARISPVKFTEFPRVRVPVNSPPTDDDTPAVEPTNFAIGLG
jgi:hypothetical protein